MGLSCGASVAKYVLFAFNFIFWLCGVALLGVGIWVRVDKNALEIMNVVKLGADDSLVQTSAYVMIAVGAFVFLTGFLGCCGAIRENTCMLGTYAGILVFLIILQVVAGILAAIFKDKIGSELKDSMVETVRTKYSTKDNSGITKSWDFTQVYFKCCGAVDGPSEWENTWWWNNTRQVNETVPKTCCKLQNNDADNPVPVNTTACYIAAANATLYDPEHNYIYSEGCNEALHNWVIDKTSILIGVSIGLATVQIFGIIMACCLMSAVRNQGVIA